ncbi:MAG: hypothetical protein RIF46_08390, partial [Cyclobacteriaceae bacterium]
SSGLSQARLSERAIETKSALSISAPSEGWDLPPIRDQGIIPLSPPTENEDAPTGAFFVSSGLSQARLSERAIETKSALSISAPSEGWDLPPIRDQGITPLSPPTTRLSIEINICGIQIFANEKCGTAECLVVPYACIMLCLDLGII